MDKRQSSEILELCLEQVLTGQDMIVSALARHSDYAETLSAELDAALWLQDQRGLLEMRPGYLGPSRQRLVAQISQPVPAKKALLAWNQSAFRLAFSALFLFVSVFSAWGGVQAVSGALPGDTLHQFKLAAEDIQLSITSNPAEQAFLLIKFADIRAGEIETLLELGRYEDLAPAFEGYRTNLAIAGDLVVKLDTTPEREIALAQELEHKVSEHNQAFSDALTEAAASGLPSDIVDTIRITIASNNDIWLTMIVLLDELGAEPLPFSAGTSTPSGTPSLTPIATLTPSPSETPEPGLLAEPGDHSTPVVSSEDRSGDVSTDERNKDKVEDPDDKDHGIGNDKKDEDPNDKDKGIGNDKK
jgi:hypothetical protein